MTAKSVIKKPFILLFSGLIAFFAAPAVHTYAAGQDVYPLISDSYDPAGRIIPEETPVLINTRYRAYREIYMYQWTPDGTLSTTSEYHYNNEGDQTEYININRDGSYKYETRNIYDSDGRLIKTDTLINDVLKYYYLYTYDDNGVKTDSYYYIVTEDGDELSEHTVYEYEDHDYIYIDYILVDKALACETVYDTEGRVAVAHKYEYERTDSGWFKVKSINYGQNMTLQDYTVYERDSYGRTTGSTTYDSDNVEKSRMVYEYAGDEIGTKEFEEITADYRYNENDSLTNHNIYEYDENGNALRTLYYYDFVTSDSPLFYCTYVFHEFTFGDEPDIRNAVFEYYDNVAPEGTFLLYRMYNPNSGEHFWTGSKTEGTNLAEAGWIFEGPGWIAPLVGEPVYRVFNPNANDHFYTTDESEKNTLVNVGWQYEGVCWNSAPDTGKPMYRLYNPNAYDLGQSGAHHYTESIAERDDLISVGWIDEGIAWYAQ